MDAFKALTRGIHFNTKKYPSEASKFGLKVGTKSAKNKTEDSFPGQEEVDFPVSLDDHGGREDSIASSDCSEEEEEMEEHQELILLDDIKVQPKRVKKKLKKKKSAEKARQLYEEGINRFRNMHRIHVSGQDIPVPIDKWYKLKDQFGCSDELLSTISEHYPSPTPIQMQCIPLMLEKREVLSCAPTGSGKTASFLIPVIHLLQGPRKKGFRVVIVAPTRELALQIHREATKFSQASGLKVLVLDQMNKATKKFSSETACKYDILVTTPNKLVFMIKDQLIDMKSVEWLIIDESDKLFESGTNGFRDQLATIYRACDQANVRRALFSATLAPDVENWCKLNLDNVVSVTIGARNTATENVEQKLIYTGTEKGKLYAMRQLVSEGIQPPVLIFVQTKERAKELHEVLSKDPNLKVDSIHSERSQLQRDNSIKSFRSGRVWILICTELLGRGIDFKGVNLVINYDFPPTTVSYIHRIGRTGRAGKRGTAVTFFTNEDKVLLRSIATVIKNSGGEVPEYMLKLKKASRQEKRNLARNAVKRKDIKQGSKYENAMKKKKEEMIEASKKRKRKSEEEEEAESNNSEKKIKKKKK